MKTKENILTTSILEEVKKRLGNNNHYDKIILALITITLFEKGVLLAKCL